MNRYTITDDKREELIKKTSETKITPGLQDQTLFGQTPTESNRILISGQSYILAD